jgi:hypothetical protein
VAVSRERTEVRPRPFLFQGFIERFDSIAMGKRLHVQSINAKTDNYYPTQAMDLIILTEVGPQALLDQKSGYYKRIISPSTRSFRVCRGIPIAVQAQVVSKWLLRDHRELGRESRPPCLGRSQEEGSPLPETQTQRTSLA